MRLARPPSLACHRAQIRGRQISPTEREILPQREAYERVTQQFLVMLPTTNGVRERFLLMQQSI